MDRLHGVSVIKLIHSTIDKTNPQMRSQCVPWCVNTSGICEALAFASDVFVSEVLVGVEVVVVVTLDGDF
jgi:hypothetical protein